MLLKTPYLLDKISAICERDIQLLECRDNSKIKDTIRTLLINEAEIFLKKEIRNLSQSDEESDDAGLINSILQRNMEIYVRLINRIKYYNSNLLNKLLNL